MSKQKKLQQYIFKINSTLLAKNNWDLKLPLERARRVPGLVVSLADSQILTWINELNGTANIDVSAKDIKSKIKELKCQPICVENKRTIRSLYTQLYQLQFKEDYICVIMDKKAHYDRCNAGFKVNGIAYRRILCTTNGVKTSTVVYVSQRLHAELKKRVTNGRDESVSLVPAKLGAYESLCASASVPVSDPHGVIVVHDCSVTFKADLINIDDSDTSKEPVVTFTPQQEVVNDCSDGCGMMLPSLSKRWNDELNHDAEHTLSGCNLRNAFTKGMVFTFDFIKFAEEVAGTYFIKDVWGDERDVRDAELILTESQLKLWNCYKSWEDYHSKCVNNHYTFRVTKTAPTFEEMDDIRQTNYQFIQPLDLDDYDIAQLIAPTTNEIKDIMGADARKSIVYLCGKGLDEKTIKYAEPIAKALMIEPSIIGDPYLRNRIRKMIDKRIRDAKIGVLDVHGNFQILSGDLYALCESIFGLEPHGLLAASEIYSYYWAHNAVQTVFCARAPMSNAHSLVSRQISYSSEAAKWFQYMDSVVIMNAWDTSCMALNGCDFDGDLLFTTDNEVLLKNQTNLPALNCVQYKAKKCVVTENDMVISNKKGFGSKIGPITNRITEMTTLMASLPVDSEEYKILKYRTQCGQAQQQAEIDKAKGIVSNPMPTSWYVWAANRVQPDDLEEIKVHKALYQRICAHKKPYFFQYNYLYLRTDYLTYVKQANENCMSLFNKTLQDLLNCQEKTADEQQFINIYSNKMPLDFSPSTMNRICWMIEDIFDGVNYFGDVPFDYTKLKTDTIYDYQDYLDVKKLCAKYKEDCLSARKQVAQENDDDELDSDQLMLILEQSISAIVPNQDIQCNILLDLCYCDGFTKQIVWDICGDTIVDHLLQTHDHQMTYPSKCAQGDFTCGGTSFQMKAIKYGGEDHEEL